MLLLLPCIWAVWGREGQSFAIAGQEHSWRRSERAPPRAIQSSRALALGVGAIASALEAVHYASKVGASGDDFTGLAALPAGLMLLGLGVVTLWGTRRTEGRRAWRYTRRGLLGAGGVVVAFVVVFPIGLARRVVGFFDRALLG